MENILRDGAAGARAVRGGDFERLVFFRAYTQPARLARTVLGVDVDDEQEFLLEPLGSDAEGATRAEEGLEKTVRRRLRLRIGLARSRQPLDLRLRLRIGLVRSRQLLDLPLQRLFQTSELFERRDIQDGLHRRDAPVLQARTQLVQRLHLGCQKDTRCVAPQA